MKSPRPRREGVASGFSMLEVLVTLALIALLGGLFIGASARLLNTRSASAEEIFWKAVTTARGYALTHGQDVRLAYLPKEKAFDATTPEGSRRYPIPYAGELNLEFMGVGSGGRSTVLIGGTLVETQTLPFVTFYADGTCTAFRVQIRTGGAATEPRYLTIDPWTCAPVLKSGNQRG